MAAVPERPEGEFGREGISGDSTTIRTAGRGGAWRCLRVCVGGTVHAGFTVRRCRAASHARLSR
ncbi:hypothetical protein C0058_07610 [Pseudomonas sp. NC02]|nr:hypothetical protein C0058_07610 [Pseudomonas sp. NC02]